MSYRLVECLLAGTLASIQLTTDIFFLTRGSLHHESMLIKRSNLMQQYADIYLLQNHSTCFRCHSTHHQEH